ncbi:MAG: VOC family protein [Armatimonas sp.]
MPTTQITPYLFFGGRCQEALDFYQSALGAQVDMVMLYNQSPELNPDMIPAGFEDKVMHSSFHIGEAEIYAGDGNKEGDVSNGFSLALTLPTEAEVEKAFAGLSDGGQVQMPLGKTFWSPCFGMVTDKFGIDWMLTVPMGG